MNSMSKLFTISNVISIIRILLLPPFWYYSYLYSLDSNWDNSIIPLSICLFAVVSDFLDGYIARKFGQESSLGQYLDPISDKVVTIGGLTVAYLYFRFPLTVLILYTIRDLLGMWVGGFLYWKRGVLAKPNYWGKWGVGVVAFAVFWHMIQPVIQNKDLPYLFFHPELSAIVLLFVLIGGSYTYIRTYGRLILTGK
jgi:CDP-diacylglycerol--glycerol-3-phosphate 3-phosphatidyltransferase